MKTIIQSGVLLIVALSLLASCGGGGGGAAPVCTPTGNMSLHSTSTGTTPLLNITMTRLKSDPVTTVPVFVRYLTPPVAAVLAGYAPEAVNPQTYGIDIASFGSTTANPLQFNVTFTPTPAVGTYQAAWRFVAVDQTATEVEACQDLPVTFTIMIN